MLLAENKNCFFFLLIHGPPQGLDLFCLIWKDVCTTFSVAKTQKSQFAGLFLHNYVQLSSRRAFSYRVFSDKLDKTTVRDKPHRSTSGGMCVGEI